MPLLYSSICRISPAGEFRRYDKKQNSEPLMLRNLFIQWLKGLHPQTDQERAEAWGTKSWERNA